jgi:Flp pilus assembly protein TadD
MEKVRREREAAEAEKKKKQPKKVVKTVEQIEAERLLRAAEEEKKTPKKKSIADLQREGAQAQRTRNWAQAEKIYQEIVSQRPSAKNQVLLGRSLYEQSKFGQARRVLQTASKGDVEGYKWLGYIAREEGDDAGANQHFSTYLKSNPVDAAIIKRVMNGE